MVPVEPISPLRVLLLFADHHRLAGLPVQTQGLRPFVDFCVATSTEVSYP